MRVLYALLAVLCLKSVRSEPTACKSIDSADGLFRSGSGPEYSAKSLSAGPYTLAGSSRGITVRWVSHGYLPDCLTLRKDGGRPCIIGDCSSLTKRHVHTVRGLLPHTQYRFAVGRAVADADWTRDRTGSFTTHPTPGNVSALRLWVLGDFGTGDKNQQSVLAGAMAYMRDGKGPPGPEGKRMPDAGIMLGDNAYSVGSHADYRRTFFAPYRRVLPHLPIWPVIGNHDTYSFQPGRRPYFDLFGSETPAEGPSVASGTAAYYSWNWGHVHFVALETNHVNYCNMRARNGGQHGGGGIHRAPPRFDCGPGAEAAGNSGGNGSAAEWARGERVGEMVAWLQRDLSAVSADPRVRWLVAYLHHSPYMRGDHNSDNSGKEPQSAFARAHLLPLLEEAGVDLVLSGHSHSYQRMCLLDGLYGLDKKLARHDVVRSRGGAEADRAWREGRLLEAKKLSPGGMNRLTARFVKEPGLVPRSGAVYVVAGCGGKLSGPRGFLKAWGSVQYPPEAAHPASCVSRVELGSLVLDVDGDVLTAAFVNGDGFAPDRWVIDKRGERAASLSGGEQQQQQQQQADERTASSGGARDADSGREEAREEAETTSGWDGAGDNAGAARGAAGAETVGGPGTDRGENADGGPSATDERGDGDGTTFVVAVGAAVTGASDEAHGWSPLTGERLGLGGEGGEDSGEDGELERRGPGAAIEEALVGEREGEGDFFTSSEQELREVAAAFSALANAAATTAPAAALLRRAGAAAR